MAKANSNPKKLPSKAVATVSPTKQAPAAAGSKTVSTQVRQPRVEKYMGKAERVQTYLKNSSSQIKSGIKELKAKPLNALSRLFKSLPQGRAARLLAGGALGAGTAYTAGKIVGNEVEAKTRSAAEKRKAYEAARDDVPGRQTAPAKKEAPKAAPKEAPKGGSKASASKASGGKYPVYPKNSSQAASFRAAFASARKAGKKVFTWEGRKYNTKLKGE